MCISTTDTDSVVYLWVRVHTRTMTPLNIMSSGFHAFTLKRKARSIRPKTRTSALDTPKNSDKRALYARKLGQARSKHPKTRTTDDHLNMDIFADFHQLCQIVSHFLLLAGGCSAGGAGGRRVCGSLRSLWYTAAETAGSAAAARGQPLTAALSFPAKEDWFEAAGGLSCWSGLHGISAKNLVRHS